MYVYILVHTYMYTKIISKGFPRWQQKIPWKYTLTLHIELEICRKYVLYEYTVKSTVLKSILSGSNELKKS